MDSEGVERSGEGFFVPSVDPDLPKRFVDGPDSPAFRRSMELSAKRRRN